MKRMRMSRSGGYKATNRWTAEDEPPPSEDRQFSPPLSPAEQDTGYVVWLMIVILVGAVGCSMVF